MLKILLTNHCIFDCAYCVSRKSNDIKRAAFTVQEVVDLTIGFYRRNYIEGLFEGKMKGKVIHFANKKILDLSEEEAQYFLDVTGARAISGYGSTYNKIASCSTIDKAFFSLYQDNDDLIEVVEELYQKHHALCQLLDFRLYYFKQ
ncbi:DUF6642 family protein [Flavobacterium sp. LBUM151]